MSVSTWDSQVQLRLAFTVAVWIFRRRCQHNQNHKWFFASNSSLLSASTMASLSISMAALAMMFHRPEWELALSKSLNEKLVVLLLLLNFLLKSYNHNVLWRKKNKTCHFFFSKPWWLAWFKCGLQKLPGTRFFSGSDWGRCTVSKYTKFTHREENWRTEENWNLRDVFISTQLLNESS